MDQQPPRLEAVDLNKRIGKRRYYRELAQLQLQLMQVQQTYLFSGEKAVIVFEGWDAAGKGGTIRRISQALDPRSFKVWPIGAPRNYYLERHYLLRFMERLPPNGTISAFDRSWYGRVMVERVEGLTPEHRWRAAYGEINDFERMLFDDGIRVIKLFFHISPDVQLKRFEDRLRNPLKRWKLTFEDFRNRAHWSASALAIDEMFEQTSTDIAPWHVIPANQKKYARIKAMKVILKQMTNGLDMRLRGVDQKLLDEADKIEELDSDLIRSLRGRTD
ncbi:polyphosphate kinase 2 [Seohaeicola saemankumensis]|nr:polyphosphate kinase 2 [Seohaeicola saemankumensis]MCA0873331.1 polyphosphate kinase 2 [Seohaeicola saemankumensis]